MNGLLVGLILLLVIVFVCVIIFVMYKRHKKNGNDKGLYNVGYSPGDQFSGAANLLDDY